MGRLPSTLLRRPTLFTSTAAATSTPTTTSSPSAAPTRPLQQVRHATFVPRPRRPYQFTQLVQLSDGSTYTVRTTMPTALYKSNKDSRNHILWQPSETSLKNVEVDEAGKLAAFRERFGRNWDMDGGAEGEGGAAAEAAEGKKKADGKAEAAATAAPAAPEAAGEDPFDSLVDLISAYSKNDKPLGGKTAKELEKEAAMKKEEAAAKKEEASKKKKKL